MLPSFYQTHLKSQFNLADYILLKILIILLQSIKKVKLEALLPLCQFQLNLLVEERNYKDFWAYQISQLRKSGYRLLGRG